MLILNGKENSKFLERKWGTEKGYEMLEEELQ